MSANSFAVTKSHYATICLNCSWKQNIQTKISTPQTHPLHNTFLAYCTSLKHCLFCTDQRKTAQSWASTFSSSNTSHISSLWASSKVWKAPCWPTPDSNTGSHKEHDYPTEVTLKPLWSDQGLHWPHERAMSSICCGSQGTCLGDNHRGTVVTQAVRQNTCNDKQQHFCWGLVETFLRERINITYTAYHLPHFHIPVGQ